MVLEEERLEVGIFMIVAYLIFMIYFICESYWELPFGSIVSWVLCKYIRIKTEFSYVGYWGYI